MLQDLVIAWIAVRLCQKLSDNIWVNWLFATFLGMQFKWLMSLCRMGDVMVKIFEKELYFLEQCLRVNPKCYSTWHQRCWIMDKMEVPDWKRELALCNKFLEYDERNCKEHSADIFCFQFLCTDGDVFAALDINYSHFMLDVTIWWCT